MHHIELNNSVVINEEVKFDNRLSGRQEVDLEEKRRKLQRNRRFSSQREVETEAAKEQETCYNKSMERCEATAKSNLCVIGVQKVRENRTEEMLEEPVNLRIFQN